jgi:hypothetical protein
MTTQSVAQTILLKYIYTYIHILNTFKTVQFRTIHRISCSRLLSDLQKKVRTTYRNYHHTYKKKKKLENSYSLNNIKVVACMNYIFMAYIYKKCYVKSSTLFIHREGISMFISSVLLLS